MFLYLSQRVTLRRVATLEQREVSRSTVHTFTSSERGRVAVSVHALSCVVKGVLSRCPLAPAQ